MSGPARSPKKQTHRRMRRRTEIRFGPEAPTCLGYSRNVSPTGMMIGSLKVFAPGTLLNLRVIVEGARLDLRGQVIWARHGPPQWLATGRIGMGIRFIDPPLDLLSRMGLPASYGAPSAAKAQSTSSSGGQS